MDFLTQVRKKYECNLETDQFKHVLRQLIINWCFFCTHLHRCHTHSHKPCYAYSVRFPWSIMY